MELSKIDQIIDRYEGESSMLIEVLHDVQAECNWLPKEALVRISQRLETPLSQIYRVATYDGVFSVTPRGRHLVRVCQGTLCAMRGSGRLLSSVQQAAGLTNGETTADLRFTVKATDCLGTCALGPVMALDGKVHHGRLSVERIEEILGSLS